MAEAAAVTYGCGELPASEPFLPSVLVCQVCRDREPDDVHEEEQHDVRGEDEQEGCGLEKPASSHSKYVTPSIRPQSG